MIFLPGTDQQIRFFLNTADIREKKVLVIGPGTIDIAREIGLLQPMQIIIIVNDYDSLITMRYRLDKSKENNIEIRMMEYGNTDFRKESIDVVFAQASVSTSERNKIVKEIKKILKPGGIFCAGEIVKLKENPPEFVKDIWKSSDLLPLANEELGRYYEERGFEIIDKKDLSYTLKEFYQQSEKMLLKETEDLSEQEKSYYKKLLRRISHESNTYLRLGGSDYTGFTALIMRKK